MFVTVPFIRPPFLVAGLLAVTIGITLFIAHPIATPIAACSPRGHHRLRPYDDGGIHRSGMRCEISRARARELFAPDRFGSGLPRFVPSIGDGRPNGVKIYAIRPGSVAARLGLHNGDTITRINGIDVSSPDGFLTAYAKLRSSDYFTIDGERGMRKVHLEYLVK